jgi:cytoskeletal protein CcmA (bactofilin family)
MRATGVDLKGSAIVVGDITTQRISIEEGAHLKGSVNIQKEAHPRRKYWVRLLFPQVGLLSQKKDAPLYSSST